MDSKILSTLVVAAMGGDALAKLARESGGRIVEDYPVPQNEKEALATPYAECYNRRSCFDEMGILT